MYTTSVSSKTYGLNSTSELQTALHIKLQAVKNRGEKKDAADCYAVDVSALGYSVQCTETIFRGGLYSVSNRRYFDGTAADYSVAANRQVSNPQQVFLGLPKSLVESFKVRGAIFKVHWGIFRWEFYGLF